MTAHSTARSPRRLAIALAVVAALLSSGCGSDQVAVTPATPSTAQPYDYCGNAPPDTACYAAKRVPSSPGVALARAIADRYIAEHSVESQRWNWEPAVVMFALTELYRVTGDVRYRQYYQAWIDFHITTGYAIHTSDTCVPALIAALLYGDLNDAAYRQVVDDALEYLDHRALRTVQGGLNHLGDSNILGVTLWVDSLFMFGNLLTRWSEITGDATRLDMMGTQFHIFTDLLQSPGGFYVHAYGYRPRMDTDIYWGRGNGWVMAAGYDYLRARLRRGERDTAVEDALRKQVSAAIAAQDASTGMWWTILNRPGETYLETSAGALFAYGMARGYRYGFLGSEVLPVIASAMDGVHRNIATDARQRPVVTGVSLGTSAGTFEYYKSVAVADDVSFGVGAVILALIETSGLPK